MVGGTITTREAHFIAHHNPAHSQHNEIQLGAEMSKLDHVALIILAALVTLGIIAGLSGALP